VDLTGQRVEEVLERLGRIEAALSLLAQRQAVKEWYTTAELARVCGKAEFTIREWCRHGRIRAQKRQSGRGAHPAWVVSHDEVLRYQREGLLPPMSARVGGPGSRPRAVPGANGGKSRHVPTPAREDRHGD
jgi:hypothetical protein